jgi:hypothetical protein
MAAASSNAGTRGCTPRHPNRRPPSIAGQTLVGHVYDSNPQPSPYPPPICGFPPNPTPLLPKERGRGGKREAPARSNRSPRNRSRRRPCIPCTAPRRCAVLRPGGARRPEATIPEPLLVNRRKGGRRSGRRKERMKREPTSIAGVKPEPCAPGASTPPTLQLQELRRRRPLVNRGAGATAQGRRRREPGERAVRAEPATRCSAYPTPRRCLCSDPRHRP